MSAGKALTPDNLLTNSAKVNTAKNRWFWRACHQTQPDQTGKTLEKPENSENQRKQL